MIKSLTQAVIDNLGSQASMALFPKYEARSRWDGLDPNLRHRAIEAGEAYINYEWPQLKATAYKQYIEDGLHVSHYYQRYMDRRHALGTLLIAECVEGKGRFMDDLINGVFAICEESTWVVPQHNKNMHKAIAMDPMTPCKTTDNIDLFCAETGATMALCLYLLEATFDHLSINIAARIKAELDQRIMTPYLTYADYFWMGYTQEKKYVNNWNPWINSNCLTVYLLACQDDEMRKAGVARVMESAQFYVNYLGSEGGCNEGPAYWSVGPGRLFELMEQLTYATDGKVKLYTSDKFKNMGSYIYKMYIGHESYVNFADAMNKDRFKDGGQIYRFGLASGDPLLQSFGQSIFQTNDLFGVSDNNYKVYRTLHALFSYDHLMASPAKVPYCQSAFIRDIDIAVGRQEADATDGLFFAAKGGHNGESHNHNDVGQVVVYHMAQPVLIDPGPLEYSQQYFDHHRYDFWATQSDYHNLPTVNGCMQKDGEGYKASKVINIDEDRLTGIQMAIDQAYPREAKLKEWVRSVGLYRQAQDNSYLTISDRYEFEERLGMTTLNYVTTRKPTVVDKKTVLLQAYEDSPEILLSYDQKFADIFLETLDLSDSDKMSSQWGQRLYRISFVIDHHELRNERIMTVRAYDEG